MTQLKDIRELNLKELEQVLLGWGRVKFHARQVFSWIYKKGILDFARMSDLPQELRGKLKETFSISGLELAQHLTSKDKTEKFLLKLNDGNLIEAVIIPADHRDTGCVSTQAGCKYACSFCASGLSGFRRNLTCAEIIEEVLLLKKYAPEAKLTHLVFMGVGEPLDNYDNVLKSIRIINSKEALNIGARRITISTCGLIPQVEKLADEGLQIELSISLHSADDKIRSEIMPVNKKYPLGELIKACRKYIKKTNRQITFEYILIKGLNSDLKQAENLVRLLRDLNCKVNLIPANAVKEAGINPPDRKDILLFSGYLARHKLKATLRKPRGEDIQAACGQLRLSYQKV